MTSLLLAVVPAVVDGMTMLSNFMWLQAGQLTGTQLAGLTWPGGQHVPSLHAVLEVLVPQAQRIILDLKPMVRLHCVLATLNVQPDWLKRKPMPPADAAAVLDFPTVSLAPACNVMIRTCTRILPK